MMLDVRMTMMMELNAVKVELWPKYRPQKAAPVLIWPRLVRPNTPADQNYLPNALKTNLQIHLRIKTHQNALEHLHGISV